MRQYNFVLFLVMCCICLLKYQSVILLDRSSACFGSGMMVEVFSRGFLKLNFD